MEVSGPLGFFTTAVDPDPADRGPGVLLIVTEPPDVVGPGVIVFPPVIPPGANLEVVGPGHCGRTG